MPNALPRKDLIAQIGAIDKTKTTAALEFFDEVRAMTWRGCQPVEVRKWVPGTFRRFSVDRRPGRLTVWRLTGSAL